MLLASGTKAGLASSLTRRSSMEGWKAKSNCSRVRWKGRWARRVRVVRYRIPAGGHLGPQQFGQHVGIGQLLAGG